LSRGFPAAFVNPPEGLILRQPSLPADGIAEPQRPGGKHPALSRFTVAETIHALILFADDSDSNLSKPSTFENGKQVKPTGYPALFRPGDNIMKDLLSGATGQI